MLKVAHFTLVAPTATFWFGEAGSSDTETPVDEVTEFIVITPEETAAKVEAAAVGVTGWPSWLSMNIPSEERWIESWRVRFAPPAMFARILTMWFCVESITGAAERSKVAERSAARLVSAEPTIVPS